MRILITGANGQVGSELVALASQQDGVEVQPFSSTDLDITNRQTVYTVIERARPTAVINAAAYTAVDAAEDHQEKAFNVNEAGVLYLAEACKQFDIPLIHLSTDYVFNGEKEGPYTENDQVCPVSVYGRSKLAGEQVLAKTWNKHLILRVSWVFGVHGNNFVKTMLRLASERDSLGVVDDQYGAPMAARSIAQCIIDLICDEGFAEVPWGTYHLQSEPGVTWYVFAKVIFEQAFQLGLISKIPEVNPIDSSAFPSKVKRPANSKLNSLHCDMFPVLDWREDLRIMLAQLKQTQL